MHRRNGLISIPRSDPMVARTCTLGLIRGCPATHQANQPSLPDIPMHIDLGHTPSQGCLSSAKKSWPFPKVVRIRLVDAVPTNTKSLIILGRQDIGPEQAGAEERFRNSTVLHDTLSTGRLALYDHRLGFTYFSRFSARY